MDERILLLKLARMGAMEHYITITTSSLGEEIGTSQQSASIYLKKLSSKGLVERSLKRAGTSLRITNDGVELLMGMYNELGSLFGTGREIEAVGKISCGLGEGAYYLSQQGYIDQIKEQFHIDPFPGTLNILLSRPYVPLLDLLRKGPGIKVEGFRSGERTFGACLCYPCSVNEIKSVVMVPNRTLHNDTIEVVSDVKLRDELMLEDGDRVTVSITYPARKPDPQ